MKTKEKFENDFDLIDPKKIVTFVDAFRKGEFYGMNKVTGLSFLLKDSGEKEIISMINSGNYFFGTKKEKETYDDETLELISNVFEAVSQMWDTEPEALIELGITDEVYQSLEKAVQQ